MSRSYQPDLQVPGTDIHTEKRYNTACIKMIGAVSICHYGFENARISPPI